MLIACLAARLYNIHPGHSNSCGETSTPEECMDLIASCINRAHGETTGVTVVLENVAGQVCKNMSLAAHCILRPGLCLLLTVVL